MADDLYQIGSLDMILMADDLYDIKAQLAAMTAARDHWYKENAEGEARRAYLYDKLIAIGFERDAEHRRAVRLFAALAPQCIPQEKLVHVIDQIDNWAAGMKAQLAAMTAARDDLLYQQNRLKACIEKLNADLAASEAARRG